MAQQPFTIWTNYHFPPAALQIVREGIGQHKLVLSENIQTSNLVAGKPDPALGDADIAVGQPDADTIMTLPRLKWVHLPSAGYERYDRADLRTALKSRGAALTTSSNVYDEPCAEHALAMMLSLARQLPPCQDEQRTTREWATAGHREKSHLLVGQTVVILGYGAIARRLIELLAPFRMKIIAVRRTVGGNEVVQTVPDSQMLSVLPLADHVVTILPGGPATRHMLNHTAFNAMKPGAIFYNIGRGTTVDETALLSALHKGHVAFAYLDVTDPEPLPPHHLLWSSKKCLITPHTAGGHADEFERLARHFVENLKRYEAGGDLLNRVI